jgi:hypothetical protein
MGPRSCQRRESAPLAHGACASWDCDRQSALERLKSEANSITIFVYIPAGYDVQSILVSNKSSHRQIPIPNEALLALIMLIDIPVAEELVLANAGRRSGQ